MNRNQEEGLIHSQKRTTAWIVFFGGTAVLASYANSLSIDPATRADLWGGVPRELQKIFFF